MKWTPPRQLEWKERFGAGWLGDLYRVPGEDGAPLLVRVVAPGRRGQWPAITALLEQNAALAHPHLLPVSPPARRGDELMYAMPLAVGGSLRTRLGGGERPAPPALLDLAEQIAAGLIALHAQGRAHGHLKPENVLLRPLEPGEPERPSGLHVWLSDAGLGALRPGDPQSPYLSPRQREGQAATVQAATGQGDLYGLGALLYEGLSGRPAPLHPGLEDLRALPHGLRNVVGRALGLLPTFADVPALLRELRTLAPTLQGQGPGQGGAPLTVELLAEQTALILTPGEAQTLRLTAQSSEAVVLSLMVEGWPEPWVGAPPTLSLAPGTPTSVALTLLVPRLYSALPKTYEVEVLALRGEVDDQGSGERLAHLPLRLDVSPFSAGTLDLRATEAVVGSALTLRVQLNNEGNQGQVYHLALTLPPGSALEDGTLHRQFELPPGGEYKELLGVHLPPAWLRGAERSFTVVAHSLVPGSLGPGGEAAWPPSRATLEASATVRQRPLLPWWGALLLAGALAGGSVWAARPPEIREFGVIGPAPVRGEPFTLGWEASGARRVQIVELPQERLNTEGRVQVPGVAAGKTYTLVASGLFSERREQITVQPTAPTPRIVKFEVTPGQARYGETVQVTWEVAYTPRARLAPFGAVPLRGSREVTLTRDLTFTLDANPPGRDSDQLRSRVTATLRPPVIGAFSVTPARVQRGQSVTLSWRVEGARQVRLAPLGTLPASGSRTLRPREDAAFVLKASNGQQEVTQSAAVTVTAPPVRIEAFTVVPERPVIGQPLKVFWRTAYAQSVELRWGDQRQVLPSQGQLSLVATAQMRTMNLVARPDEGEAALETRRLDLAAPPAPVVRPAPAPATPPSRTPAPPTAQTPENRAPENRAPAPRPSPTRTPEAPAPSAQRPSTQSPPPRAPAARAPTTQVPTPPAPSTPRPVPRPAPQPTPAPAPAPARIVGFRSVTPAPIAGRPLTLRWQVSGETQVLLRGEGGRLLGRFPARGSYSLTPTRAGRLTFTLSSVRDPSKRSVIGVQVSAPRATPRPPAAPQVTRPPQVTPQPAPRSQFTPNPRPEARAAQISEFRAAPALVSAGQATTLVWRVSGVNKVYIAGLSGPNVDGSFPPSASVITPRLSQSRTFVLNAGGVRRTLPVTVRPVTARSPLTPTPPTPARPSAGSPGAGAQVSRYAFLEGPWSHTFGRLSLKVSSNRASGVLTSNSARLPSGTVRGSLRGDADAPTFSGFLSAGGEERAILLRFDPERDSFEGVYVGEGERQRWCGWRGSGRPEGC